MSDQPGPLAALLLLHGGRFMSTSGSRPVGGGQPTTTHRCSGSQLPSSVPQLWLARRCRRMVLFHRNGALPVAGTRNALRRVVRHTFAARPRVS